MFLTRLITFAFHSNYIIYDIPNTERSQVNNMSH